MDAACYNTNQVNSQETGHKAYTAITGTCMPTASTTDFAVRLADGNTIKLDATGNSHAASAIQDGALMPNRKGVMRVRVSGTLEGEVLQTASFRPARGSKGAMATNGGY